MSSQMSRSSTRSTCSRASIFRAASALLRIAASGWFSWCAIEAESWPSSRDARHVPKCGSIPLRAQLGELALGHVDARRRADAARRSRPRAHGREPAHLPIGSQHAVLEDSRPHRGQRPFGGPRPRAALRSAGCAISKSGLLSLGEIPDPRSSARPRCAAKFMRPCVSLSAGRRLSARDAVRAGARRSARSGSRITAIALIAKFRYASQKVGSLNWRTAPGGTSPSRMPQRLRLPPV